MPLTLAQRLAAITAAAFVAVLLFEATAFVLERLWDDAPSADGFAVGAAVGGAALTARAMNRSFRDRAIRRLVAQPAEPPGLDDEEENAEAVYVEEHDGNGA
jgi:hypothetical protein